MNPTTRLTEAQAQKWWDFIGSTMIERGEISPKLKPFPDVPAALARMRTRYKIAVLSNGDPDMLEAALCKTQARYRRLFEATAGTGRSELQSSKDVR